MSTLQSQLASFNKERAEAVSRNIGHSRPVSSRPARVLTPQPSSSDAGAKRDRDTAFAPPLPTSGAGQELFTNVQYAISYLKSKSPQALPFEEIIRHLSLPVDAEKNVPNIRRALEGHDSVNFIRRGEDGALKDSFKYRPKHPVTNAEELKDYLARQPTAQGIPVKELKDGWANCIPVVDKLEKEGAVLVIRQKKDNMPKTVYADSPEFHIHVDDEFKDFWKRIKLPGTETEVRAELEKSGITPTSQVKEVKRVDMRKKERKRPNRRGGKTTNLHMAGILKDYSRR